MRSIRCFRRTAIRSPSGDRIRRGPAGSTGGRAPRTAVGSPRSTRAGSGREPPDRGTAGRNRSSRGRTGFRRRRFASVRPPRPRRCRYRRNPRRCSSSSPRPRSTTPGRIRASDRAWRSAPRAAFPAGSPRPGGWTGWTKRTTTTTRPPRELPPLRAGSTRAPPSSWRPPAPCRGSMIAGPPSVSSHATIDADPRPRPPRTACGGPGGPPFPGRIPDPPRVSARLRLRHLLLLAPPPRRRESPSASGRTKTGASSRCWRTRSGGAPRTDPGGPSRPSGNSAA
mmetsp:Transcript_6043/g.14970  ORF Transcript_6043/g.14970 Transcript_6043/m.14970 type:complete len:282 (+) Transcript_6043:358-1203(+)